MKILVNPDNVPTTLDECLNDIKQYLDEEDISQLKKYNKNPFVKEQVGAVTFLEYAWTLTDTESLLVRWFKDQYGVDNSFQIASIVLYCIYCDVKEVPRKIKDFIGSSTKGKKKKVKSKEK